MKILFRLFLMISLLTPMLAAEGTLTTRAPLQTVDVNGISIAWTETGRADGPPLLMVMGLGGSHTLWGDKLPEALGREGYRVILFDNRDVGASTRFSAYGQPVLWWNFLTNKLGFGVNTPYTLTDMAADVVGLMDALDIQSAHIMGASMGGMIAQTIAVQYPDRTRSLISVMSTTGAPHLPQASDSRTGDLVDIATAEGERREELNQMGFFPSGMGRQLMAIMDAGDRTAAVATIRAPTLVLHGKDDGLIPVEHGRFTAETIPGARFVAYDGMEHNIPDAVRPLLVAEIHAHISALEKSAVSADTPDTERKAEDTPTP